MVYGWLLSAPIFNSAALDRLTGVRAASRYTSTTRITGLPLFVYMLPYPISPMISRAFS